MCLQASQTCTDENGNKLETQSKLNQIPNTMRTEQELKEVQRLANYFLKVIEESAKTMKYYDILNVQYNALWEYCEERIECSNSEDRMRVMKDTETYFKTMAKIIILEQKAEAYIQFG